MTYKDFEKTLPAHLHISSGLAVFMSPEEVEREAMTWIERAWRAGHAQFELMALRAENGGLREALKHANSVTIVHESWLSRILKRKTKNANINTNKSEA
jgi:hypothetical protein